MFEKSNDRPSDRPIKIRSAKILDRGVYFVEHFIP